MARQGPSPTRGNAGHVPNPHAACHGPPTHPATHPPTTHPPTQSRTLDEGGVLGRQVLQREREVAPGRLMQHAEHQQDLHSRRSAGGMRGEGGWGGGLSRAREGSQARKAASGQRALPLLKPLAPATATAHAHPLPNYAECSRPGRTQTNRQADRPACRPATPPRCCAPCRARPACAACPAPARWASRSGCAPGAATPIRTAEPGSAQPSSGDVKLQQPAVARCQYGSGSRCVERNGGRMGP